MNVDVVVCVKSQAKPLERVLKQIVSEIPFRNLIVVYATSVDATREIALKYTDKVFWDENRGLGAARNLGVKKATSEIVAMVDSDIILTRGWYQKLAKHLVKPGVAAVMGTCIYGYGNKPLERLWEYYASVGAGEWGCHNVLFNREIIMRVGNFKESIKGAGEDYDLYCRLLDAGFQWVWDRSVMVYHPMNILEYVKHRLWWEEGLSQLQDESPISPFVLSGSILKSVGYNARFLRVYPLLFFYLQPIDVLRFMVDFRVSRRKGKVVKNKS